MAFRCQRWTIANILPVAFMLGLIGIIWILYISLHVIPLVIGDVNLSGCAQQFRVHRKPATFPSPSAEQSSCLEAAFTRGFNEAIVQQVLTIVLLICFGRAIFTDPGSVPDVDEWLPDSPYSGRRGPEESGTEAGSPKKKAPKSREVKHTGARRFCKWCNRYKPDRSHHCRVCRSCILRMDHHCPWIANCVGFRNHKFFFLLVLYSLLDCAFVLLTMSESLRRSVVQETQFAHRFLIVFCMTLSAMMGVLLALFLCFHTWLMLKSTTTIEFCEKTYRHSGCSNRGSSDSIYDRGHMENVKSVLGSNMLLWFLPCGPPDGDGLSFQVAEGVDSDEAEETQPLLSQSWKEGKESKKQGIVAKAKADYKAATEDIKDVDTLKKLGKAAAVSEVADKDAEAPEVTAGEASIS